MGCERCGNWRGDAASTTIGQATDGDIVVCRKRGRAFVYRVALFYPMTEMDYAFLSQRDRRRLDHAQRVTRFDYSVRFEP
jgi:hypothetical protein